MRVCAFTSVCLEDAHWAPQYLAEATRIGVPYVVHYDRCRPEDSQLFRYLDKSQLCVGRTFSDSGTREFDERHKQAPFNLVAALEYDWAMAWDIDETYAAEFPLKLLAECTADYVDVRWLNLWGDKDHVRIDRGFAEGHRVKFYNLRGRKWVFDHPITNGAKLVGRDPVLARVYEFVCLHWGMMSPALRRMHKDRWDRIYSTALRGDPNPYGFWKDAVETETDAVTVRHGYF